ncbi:MAG: HPF/RaiA family ribosome-associated protein [Candidatus Tectomicrobia bacterium]|uniref:HPF/RaiA family ribosome-associated protein n=1 Tax=Tectimicrobiota bacterium TaxID=2528274 RepID=A0A932CQS6_UNCTE|nr:HPF/RaiA family ribosome-associated protein [Candidatus Tectomicrobia bacterium]
MKYQITFKNFHGEAHFDSLIEKLTTQLDRHIADFDPEAVFLHGVIEKNSTRSLYRASLVLNLPGRRVVARDEGFEVEATLRQAFLELERQVEKYKSFLRREHVWKRPARVETVRRGDWAEPVPIREHERALILAHLDIPYNFVRREIAYYLAMGDLIPGELTVEEAVDAVVLQAFREFHQRPMGLELGPWLLKLALEHIDAEVRRLSQERTQVGYMAEEIPEILPGEEVSMEGDEIYEFYYPEEDLRLEEIVPNSSVPTPGQILGSRDLQRYINRTLAQLPRPWRNAFVLYHVERLSLADVAAVTGQTEGELKRCLACARDFLRQKIVESRLAVVA